jgi:CRP-like cAMP-binding protein
MTERGRNRIVDGLPAPVRARLDRDVERVSLEFKRVLCEPNKPIAHVYFPLGSVVSLISTMRDGSAVEVGTVGNEGIFGLPVFLGARSMPAAALVQIAGEALRIRSDRFEAHVAKDGALTDRIHRYAQALFNQVAQSAACNRVHAIDERASRWLLMTHDRVATGAFMLTQEFLAQMLGARRAAVNEAAKRLASARLITYTRGRITILDRRGLERRSCECYRVIRDEFDRLLPVA